MQREDESCGALVDKLAQALQQDGAWQQTAQTLRQQADALDTTDSYDAHMEMGMLLTARSHSSDWLHVIAAYHQGMLLNSTTLSLCGRMVCCCSSGYALAEAANHTAQSCTRIDLWKPASQSACEAFTWLTAAHTAQAAS